LDNKPLTKTLPDQTPEPFAGAKLILFFGDQILTIRRDDKLSIPFPNMLDFPGGGREDDETPEACVLRETWEEIGIRLNAGDLIWKNAHRRPDWLSWFFAAHLPADAVGDIVFGDEGRGWQLMPPEAYVAAEDGIPHFQEQLSAYLRAK
jgi:8-oxo-dGTP diphosphatase